MAKDAFTKAKTKYKGHIQQIEIRPQARDSDDIQRLSIKVGETIVRSGEQDIPCFTNVKCYVQEPTLEHPLNIKFAMHNPAGDCFTQFKDVQEFDEFLSQLYFWRINQNDSFEYLQHKEKVLKTRRHISIIINSIVSDIDRELPTIMINGHVINDKMENEIKDRCYQIIDQILKSESGRQINALTKMLENEVSALTDRTDVENYIKIKIGHMNIKF